MRRRLSTLFCRYEPRLLSRSMTILNPSTRTCCSIVRSTFEGPIVPPLRDSLFGVRFRVEGGSARTGGILIQDRNLLPQRGQRGARAFCPLYPAFCRTFFNWTDRRQHAGGSEQNARAPQEIYTMP